jgi:hypothetical protein
MKGLVGPTETLRLRFARRSRVSAEMLRWDAQLLRDVFTKQQLKT